MDQSQAVFDNRLNLNKHKDDIEIVTLAVKQNVFALREASLRLRGDPKLVRRCIAQHPSTLRFASPELQNDLDICEFALRRDGTALRYMSVEAKKNRRLVMLAMEQSSTALSLASEKLQNDPDLIAMCHNLDRLCM